jgi:hypothetical protein
MGTNVASRMVEIIRKVNFYEPIRISYWNGMFYGTEFVTSVGIIRGKMIVNTSRLDCDDYVYYNDEGEILNNACIGDLNGLRGKVIDKIYNLK